MQDYIQIVKDRIPGLRKGSMTSAYQHSINVYHILKGCGYSLDVCLAGLFHDIIEDGGMNYKDLVAIGLNKRIIQLVKMCTHNPKLHGMEKWHDMMDKIIDSGDGDAFVIKLSDCIDNLTDVFGMQDVNKITRFITQKCPFFIYHGYKNIARSKIYNMFMEIYHTQHCTLFNTTE